MIASTRWVFWFCLFSAGLWACDDGGDAGGGDDTDGGMDDGGADDDTGAGSGCVADGDCGADEYCAFADANDPFGACEPGCRVQPDNCEGAEHCDPDDRKCTADCANDDACPADHGCVDNACVAGACRLDGSDCAAGESCDEASRACVERPFACCMDDGSCDEVLTADCEAAGGMPSRARSCDDARCAPPPDCTMDSHCEADEYCTNRNECAEGCRQEPDNCEAADEACGPDHACHTRECDADGDCPDDLYCMQPFGQCAEACDDDNACPDGFHCDAGRCARGCVDNADAEENDDLDSANALEFDEDGEATDDDGRLCPLDPDWFTVTLDAPGRLQIELECDEGDPDLSIELHDADGRLAGSNEEGCAQTLVWPANDDSSTEGAFFVAVGGAAPDMGADYTLTITALEPGGVCVPDDGEEDDGAADALLIDEDEAQIEGRTICADDADWYQLQLADGDGISIALTVRGEDALTFDLVGPGDPGPDFDVNDPLVVHPMEMAEDGTLRASLAPNNQLIRDGVWFLRVRGELEDGEGEYDLQVSVAREADGCTPDENEGNDGAGEATDLMLLEGFADGDVLAADQELTVAAQTLCAGDADWYRVVLAEGDRLSARVTLLDDEGEPLEALDPVHVAVVDVGGNLQGPEGAFTGPEVIGRSGAVAAGGDYYVRVRGPGVANAYELTVVRRAAAEMCEDDRFDGGGRNDSRETADPLDVGDQALAVADLNLCNANAPGGDSDWFTFELAAEGRLQVDVTFAHDDGDLDLEVFLGEASVGLGGSADDNERVTLANAAPGTYFVQVSSFFAAENAYDLRVEHDARVECDPDGLEANDEQEEATVAADGFDENAWVCEFPADEDWFEVAVPAGESRTFHVDFLRNDDGWLTVDAYNADGEFEATSDRLVNGQCVVVDATPEGGTWYFAVDARSFQRRDATPDRVDYRVRVGAGDNCAAWEPLLADDWLHLP